MSKAKQIIKLTEQGIKPKEIAKRTGAKISYVYFVRKRVKKGGKKKSPKIINAVQQLKNELDAYDKYKTKNTDLVNNPPHYTAGGVDFIDFAEAKGLTENAYLFNVVKYVVRAGKKADVDPVQDLREGRVLPEARDRSEETGMNPVQIGRQRFSNIFWGIVDEKVGDYPYEAIEKIIWEQQKLRADADYNTGSLPYDDAVEVYKLIAFFKPRVIAEVGTFIGVSTRTMREAMPSAKIYTCDVSNQIQVSQSDTGIFQYPKQSSTQMFKDLADKKIGIDLIYFDGRVQEEDFQYLPSIIHDHTIFVFDDFEGIEKGTVNAMRLESGTRVLIYPREGRKTAVSLPFTMLHFVAQEAT